MRPVSSHGAPKITMNSQENDYQEKLKAALAQGDGNPYISGEQHRDNSQSESEVAAKAERGPENAFSEQPKPPQESEPNQIGSNALQKRLEMYAKAGSNAGVSNNDRSETMRIS